jgi:hypothetical protein
MRRRESKHMGIDGCLIDVLERERESNESKKATPIVEDD